MQGVRGLVWSENFDVDVEILQFSKSRIQKIRTESETLLLPFLHIALAATTPMVAPTKAKNEPQP